MPRIKQNRYRDIELDVGYLTFTDEAEFVDIINIESSKWLSRLRHPHVRDTAVFWVNTPKERANVVPWLLAMTPPFVLHHANANRIMLVRPANPNAGRQCQIPTYGTHYVRVESIVVEDGTGRVLMVRERLGADSALKLVTGSVDAGEFAADAAEREVREEAGITCRAAGLVGCGNRIRTRFDRDEIIFGVLLFAPRGQVPRPDGFEVKEAGWYDVASVVDVCTPMAREWLAAASASKGIELPRMTTTDLFRGAPHLIDFFVRRASPEL